MKKFWMNFAALVCGLLGVLLLSGLTFSSAASFARLPLAMVILNVGLDFLAAGLAPEKRARRPVRKASAPAARPQLYVAPRTAHTAGRHAA